MKPELLDYELLVKAKSLIEDPAHWIQGCARAKKVDGTLVTCDYDEATHLCTYGALAKAAGSDFDPTKFAPFRLLREAINGCDPVLFNDNRTHASVMAMWDRAIAKAKELAS